MYFSTAKPVYGYAFHNRSEELELLLAMVESLKQGVPRYYALLGLHKFKALDSRHEIPLEILYQPLYFGRLCGKGDCGQSQQGGLQFGIPVQSQ